MKISKKIKRVFVWSGTLVLVLLAVLIVHIVIMVKQMPQPVNPTIQLARADFKQPIDSALALEIQEKVKETNGVKSTFFNLKQNILVYSFDNRMNSAQNIYNEAIKNCGFQSERYIVNAEDLKNGCPAMDNNSFYGKITQIVASVN